MLVSLQRIQTVNRKNNETTAIFNRFGTRISVGYDFIEDGYVVIAANKLDMGTLYCKPNKAAEDEGKWLISTTDGLTRRIEFYVEGPRTGYLYFKIRNAYIKVIE